jgi:hypothetical protein
MCRIICMLTTSTATCCLLSGPCTLCLGSELTNLPFSGWALWLFEMLGCLPKFKFPLQSKRLGETAPHWLDLLRCSRFSASLPVRRAGRCGSLAYNL